MSTPVLLSGRTVPLWGSWQDDVLYDQCHNIEAFQQRMFFESVIGHQVPDTASLKPLIPNPPMLRKSYAQTNMYRSCGLDSPCEFNVQRIEAGFFTRFSCRPLPLFGHRCSHFWFNTLVEFVIMNRIVWRSMAWEIAMPICQLASVSDWMRLSSGDRGALVDRLRPTWKHTRHIRQSEPFHVRAQFFELYPPVPPVIMQVNLCGEIFYPTQ